jgi:hypothetical protein
LGSRAEALGEVAVGIVNLEGIAGGNGDSVRKDDEVQSTGVLGGGVFDPGDAAGISRVLLPSIRFLPSDKSAAE